MKLKNKLGFILVTVLCFTLCLEVIFGIFYFNMDFNYKKLSFLKKMYFINKDNSKISFTKIEEYQKDTGALVLVLNTATESIMNIQNLSYITILSNNKIKKILIDKYFLEANREKIKVNKTIEIKVISLYGSSCYLANSFLNLKNDLKVEKNQLKVVTGKIVDINISPYDFYNIHDVLEIYKELLINKNANKEYINKLDRYYILEKRVGKYKVFVFYKLLNIELYRGFKILLPYIVINFAVLVMVTMTMGIILGKKIIEPIEKVSDVAKNIGNLNFQNRLFYEGVDEIGELYTNINKMGIKLDNMINIYRNELKNNVYENIKFQDEIKCFMHEVKTPLAAIIGFSDLHMMKNGEEKPLKIINNEGKRLLRLANELIEKKQESAEVQLEMDKFDMKTLVDLVLKIYELEFKAKNLKVILKGVKEMEIYGDSEKMEQVVINLVKNAMEYAKTTIEIELSIEKNKGKFSIANDGERIPEDNLDKIWNKYYSTNEEKSRGLGLYISSSIIRAHKNKYSVRNLENGVEFTFYMDLGF